MTSAIEALKSHTKKRYKQSEVDIRPEGHAEPVYLRWQSLSELEKSNFEAANQNKDGTPNATARRDVRLRMMIACAVDGDGRTELTAADLNWMRKLDGKIVSLASDEVMAHVGWTNDDVENLAKNLPETHDDSSP